MNTAWGKRITAVQRVQLQLILRQVCLHVWKKELFRASGSSRPLCAFFPHFCSGSIEHQARHRPSTLHSGICQITHANVQSNFYSRFGRGGWLTTAAAVFTRKQSSCRCCVKGYNKVDAMEGWRKRRYMWRDCTEDRCWGHGGMGENNLLRRPRVSSASKNKEELHQCGTGAGWTIWHTFLMESSTVEKK